MKIFRRTRMNFAQICLFRETWKKIYIYPLVKIIFGLLHNVCSRHFTFFGDGRHSRIFFAYLGSAIRSLGRCRASSKRQNRASTRSNSRRSEYRPRCRRTRRECCRDLESAQYLRSYRPSADLRKFICGFPFLKFVYEARIKSNPVGWAVYFFGNDRCSPLIGSSHVFNVKIIIWSL